MVVALPASKIARRAQDGGTRAPSAEDLIPDKHHLSSTLPFRPSFRKPNADRHAPPQSLSDNSKQAQAWFSGYIDQFGKFNIASSSVLKTYLNELFSPHFQQKLATIIAKEDSSIYIDPAVYDSNKTNLGSLRSQSPTLEKQAGKHAPGAKNKRAVSTESMSAKRRKSCLKDTEQLLRLSCVVDDNAIKTEQAPIITDETDESDDDEFVDTGYSSVAIRVDDAVELDTIIDTRLRQMQQTSCKLVAKAWIKVHEPQKQTKYPYNGGIRKEEATRQYGSKNLGELTKPPWWPSTEGWPNNGGCRHREPDHLKKPERLVLLKHMLKICPVAMLKDSTKEVQTSATGMKQFAIDHLKEIYRLRDKQERYQRGEIGENFGRSPTSPTRADSCSSSPSDGGTIIPVELVPIKAHNGSNSAKGTIETTPITTTTQNSPRMFSEAAATPGSEDPQQEPADEIVVHPTDQRSNRICQLGGENTKAPTLKDGRPKSSIQNEGLYSVSMCHDPSLPELQASRHHARLGYRNVESAHLDLSPTPHQKDAIGICDSFLGANNISFGDSSELPQTHGLPHVSTWNGFNESLAPTRYCGLSPLKMPFFNDAYDFEKPLMNDPYRSLIDGGFPSSAGTEEPGQSWDFSFAHPPHR